MINVPSDGTEPVEGVVTKNRVFFEKPVLQTIGTAVEPVRSTYTGYGRGSYSSSSDTPDVPRLRSSHNYEICPHGLRPKDVDYMFGPDLSYDQAGQYLTRMRINGFGKGAIVTRRFQSFHRFKSMHALGIIMFEMPNVVNGRPWSPYQVKWVEVPSHETQYEACWAEDLVLIHTCLDDEMLVDIIESQGVVLK